MQNGVPSSVVIVGNDIQSLLTACLFAQSLKAHGTKIKLVSLSSSQETESSHILCDANILASLSSLGLSLVKLKNTQSIRFRYGKYLYFSEVENGFVYTQSPLGKLIDRVHFHHYLARHRQSGRSVDTDQYSVAATASKEQKFVFPETQSNRDWAEFTASIPSSLLIEFLVHCANKFEVAFIEASTLDVVMDSQSEQITSLILSSQRRVNAEFYIDCTPDGILHHRVGTKSIVTQHAGSGSIRLSIQSNQCAESYLDSLSIDKAGFVVCSGSTERTYQRSELDRGQGEERTLFYLSKPWQANCLAMGKAQSFIPETLVPLLNATIESVAQFLNFLPDDPSSWPYLQKAYNRQQSEYYKCLVDAQLFPLAARDYLLGQKKSDYLTKRLLHRFQLFHRTGQFAFYEHDVLEKDQWFNLMQGAGIWPERYDSLVRKLDNHELNQMLKKHRRSVREMVDSISRMTS